MASPDFNIGPTAPVTPPSASRALTRVTPVAPQRVSETPESPLKRSGLDIRELFNAPDQVVVRSRTPAVALELGLEQARGSMVRNQPGDALAALDEVWSGARHTESGWYLRGGSLALLGLPGEASRVVAEALRGNPQSPAINFLQSLTKLMLGDVGGAQSALTNATANSEPDPLLLIQGALVAAQNDDVGGAEELLRRVAANWPEHPALAYGRDMMREVLRNKSRDGKRALGFSRTPVLVDALDQEDAEPSAEPNRVRSAAPETASTARDASGDVLADALSELGKLLVAGTKRQVLAEARVMLGSLSAGGTLASSVSAARAHAMRGILSAIMEALNTGATTPAFGWDAESVDGQWQRSTPDLSSNTALHDSNIRGNELLLNTVREVVNAIRDGRPAEAEQQLRRARGSVGDTTIQLLRSVMSGDDAFASQSPPAQLGGDQGNAYIRNGAPGHAFLAPLRLGLALLPDSELSGSKVQRTGSSDEAVTYAGAMGASTFTSSGFGTLSMNGSAGSLIAAVGLLAAAVLAFSASLPMLAVACAGGGAWLALRRGVRTP
ncbi:MAG: hypothetical protein ABJB74_05950 [Gemmatimonas sp.]